MRYCYIITICIFFLYSLSTTNAELFTALVDLQNLLYTEEEIAKTLEKYLDFEEQRLNKIKWFCKKFDKLYKAATSDIETLSNPVNAYLLVKHLSIDWNSVQDVIEDSHGQEIIKNITQQNHLKFPDEEDLSGAASALMRLQDTYLLDTATLARGIIEGTLPSPELTSGDCFELGRQACLLKKYYHAFLWLQEALNRIQKENIKYSNKIDVLEYMAYSAYKLGNVGYASKLNEELLNIDPGHPRAHENAQYYVEILRKRADQNSRNDHINIDHQNTYFIKNPAKHPARYEYGKLCRGEVVRSPMEEKELRCHYVTNNSSFLILQPAKEEELSLNPRIVYYHNVLSDKEMKIIKNLAKPKLARAQVHNSKSGEALYVNYRISKSAWLRDSEHEVVKRVTRRIEEIAGLEIETAEDLQVVNYGVGGHYEPHCDFIKDGEPNIFKSLGVGNRIATWINYMSDVDAGGSTVFPIIGVQVKPIKGSAAFWYNLFRNGEGDTSTQHAACPVLAGSKWVSNKWFHERGQEFRRPCSLNPKE